MSTNATKRFSWKGAILLSLGVGLLTATFSIAFQTRSQILKAVTVVGDAAYLEAPLELEGVGSSSHAPSKPTRLRIPSIGVDANIQDVGLSLKGDGAMGIPTNFTDVAWYNQGPVPGMPGSAVIAGHLDGKNVPRAVFYDLGKLTAGEIVEVVDEKGEIMQFKVMMTKVYDYNASAEDVFSNDISATRLNLITCGGEWIKSQKVYSQRVVVFTELIVAR